MKKINVRFQKINGEYHIEILKNGKCIGGGNTEQNNYEEAYIFACKYARSIGATLETFRSVK